MIVQEVMSSNPHSATTTTSVREAMRLLSEFDIRHLPVVDGDNLVGIVSARDLPGVVPSGISYFGDPHDVQRVLDQPVANVMSTELVTVQTDTELDEAIELMLKHRIGAIPVLENGGRKLIGILSYIDVLRVGLATRRANAGKP
ncbi:MAG: CBS domain-containing protein [Polyangiaceae bacterium]